MSTNEVIKRVAEAIYTAEGLYLSPADSMKAAGAAIRVLNTKTERAMSDDFCIEHGYEFMRCAMGNPIPYCEECERQKKAQKPGPNDPPPPGKRDDWRHELGIPKGRTRS